MEFLSLINEQVHFRFKFYWMAFFNLIEIVIEHSVSKQRRPWLEAALWVIWSGTVLFDHKKDARLAISGLIDRFMTSEATICSLPLSAKQRKGFWYRHFWQSRHMLGNRFKLKNSKWVWSGNTTITNRRQPNDTARKSRSTIMRHQEDILSKATSSLFPIKIIAILEWT